MLNVAQIRRAGQKALKAEEIRFFRRDPKPAGEFGALAQKVTGDHASRQA
jgi:hypothetical protein